MLPRRGCPSGHLGVGLAAVLATGTVSVVTADIFFPLASVTAFAQTFFSPSRAEIASTVMESPILTLSRVHPTLLSSIRLGSSTAQLADPPPASASITIK